MAPVFMIMIVFWAFEVEAFTAGDHMGIVFLILLLYLFGGTAYMYVASFFYSNPTVGFVKLTIMNILLGMRFPCSAVYVKS